MMVIIRILMILRIVMMMIFPIMMINEDDHNDDMIVRMFIKINNRKTGNK